MIVTKPETPLASMASALASEAAIAVKATVTEVDAGVADTSNDNVTRMPSLMTLLLPPIEAMMQRLPARDSVFDAAMDAAPLATPLNVKSEE